MSAVFNTVECLPEQLALRDEVYAWLIGKQPNELSAIALKFKVTPAYMRPIIDSLIAQRRVKQAKIGRKHRYMVAEASNKPLEQARTWKPLRDDPALSERYAQIKAERAAFPSKHI